MSSPRLFDQATDLLRGGKGQAESVAVASAATSAKPLVRCYFDFDGTLTALPGRDIVSTDFYNNCVGDYAQLVRGVGTSELTVNHVLEKIKEPTNNPDALNFQARAESIAQLRGLLSRDDIDVEIYTITKNLTSYVGAVLRLAGIQEHELAAFKIYDVNTGGGDKYQCVKDIEVRAASKASSVLIFDDGVYDLASMRLACQHSGYDEKSIFAYLATAASGALAKCDDVSKTSTMASLSELVVQSIAQPVEADLEQAPTDVDLPMVEAHAPLSSSCPW